MWYLVTYQWCFAESFWNPIVRGVERIEWKNSRNDYNNGFIFVEIEFSGLKFIKIVEILNTIKSWSYKSLRQKIKKCAYRRFQRFITP